MRASLSAFACLALTLLVSACTPYQALVMSLVPGSAATTLLGNLQGVGSDNRKRVIELERDGRWDELAKVADENLEKDRRNHDWWLVKGYALTQSADHRGAAQAFGEAVRIEPDSAMAWNMLAQSHRAAGDSQRAVVILERAMLVVRDAPTTPYLLGESYSDLRRYDEAAAAYRQALAMNREFSPAWAGLARAYTRLGRDADALDAQRALEKVDPGLARELEASRANSLR